MYSFVFLCQISCVSQICSQEFSRANYTALIASIKVNIRLKLKQNIKVCKLKVNLTKLKVN